MDSSDIAARSIVIRRRVAASPERVFRAFADPALTPHWWGPEGFSVSTRKCNFREGGEWDFTMVAPDGRGFENKMVFGAIAAPRRAEYRHDCAPYFDGVFECVSVDGGTEVTLTSIFADAKTRDAIATYAVAGGEQTLARLAGLVEAEAAAARSGLPDSDPSLELVLTRIVKASPQRCFEVWTQRLKDWWGPHGMTTPFVEMDLRPGGSFRTVMRAPDGAEYPTRGVFLEVDAPLRIVTTDAFDPGWLPHPEPFLTVITTFADIGGGRTIYTARALHKNKADRDEHEKMGFHSGWGQSLDRFVALVEQP